MRKGKVISFAKWHQPVPDQLKYEETPWIWPTGTDLEVLDTWTKSMDATFEKLLHQTPCFRKVFLSRPLMVRLFRVELIEQSLC